MSTPSIRNSSRSRCTGAVRAGIDRDTAFGAVTPPIVLSSNFSFAGFEQKRKYDYTRSGNPTRDLLGEALADLEGGAGGVITATGMGAITLLLHALLQPGDRLVVPHDCYGGSWRLFNTLAKKGAFELVTADLTDPRALTEALREPPKLVWIETPSNPLLRITDLRFVIEAAHKAGALVVVDNTFLSPALQQPIAFGADFVVHSTTKYINGHSDVVGGAVVSKDAAQHDQLVWWANALGLTGSPFDSFLTLRGLRTLDARLRVHEENTRALVELLDGHPAVSALHYPGLERHAGHSIAAKQQDGFGAMLSVELDGGTDAVRAFLDGLECFTLAESLGGVESLIEVPAAMTHLSTAN
ncbi:MAG TPA: cystathionine gamma-synthase, partial [Lysobacter sp.]|nr:cystathionine gamma-synthase [Lysobacter sp.]